MSDQFRISSIPIPICKLPKWVLDEGLTGEVRAVEHKVVDPRVIKEIGRDWVSSGWIDSNLYIAAAKKGYWFVYTHKNALWLRERNLLARHGITQIKARILDTSENNLLIAALDKAKQVDLNKVGMIWEIPVGDYQKITRIWDEDTRQTSHPMPTLQSVAGSEVIPSQV